MNLPEDILLQILSWLPAESLIRFKCVCKAWYALLEDQNFIYTHVNNMINPIRRNVNAHLLISCRSSMTNKRVISLSRDSSLDRFINQDLPPFFSNNFGQIRLIGPCNGIICLYGYPDQIALCNPSIGQFKILPPSQVSRPHDIKVRGGDIGIGFDSKIKDYKVIQILFCISNQSGLYYHVEIYSLGTDSWRKYDAAVPANVMYTNMWSMVYKNETFCWWAQNGNTEVILSFNMSKEIFQETPLPSDIECFGGRHRTTRSIVPLNESIALIVYRMKEKEKVFDVWVMNELVLGAHEKSTWTKQLSIGPISGVERPLGFWKSGELVLENCSRELVLYDRKTKEIKNLGLHGKRDRLEVLVYYDSIVSVQRV
ncbi:F-box protein At3g07870-like [Coffea eugenioides]|uniref:F-box protein At3g07870-like n=1 Tax=Coffea eugenioides TaxID=49369 RepID=UPI000F61454F|nr:F-box protein At3g07870-like [Coffea eugenioides]